MSSSGVAGALLSFGVCCDRGFTFRAVLPPFARVSCTVNSAPFLPICCFLLERISVELIPVLFRIASSHLSVVSFFCCCFVASFNKVCWISSNQRDVGTSQQLRPRSRPITAPPIPAMLSPAEYALIQVRALANQAERERRTQLINEPDLPAGSSQHSRGNVNRGGRPPRRSRGRPGSASFSTRDSPGHRTLSPQ